MNLDKLITNISERLDNIDPESSNKSDGFTYWKGRKIILLHEWLKISKANTLQGQDYYNIREAVKFFPESFMEGIFLLGVPDNVKELANAWYKDYLELMEFKKDPLIGKRKCFHCLLSPRHSDPLLFGISKIIARALVSEVNLSINSNDKDRGYGNSDTLYPCTVVNRFVCPFEVHKRIDEKFSVDDLFTLERIASMIESAFFVAYSMSKSNEITYEADFERDVVIEIHTMYNGASWPWDLEYSLDEKLAEVKSRSIIPIRNVNDVYEVLRDAEKLDKILGQGLSIQYLEHKGEFVKFIESIKKSVKLEDLRVAEPIWKSNRLASECIICKDFANILCVNCNDWLCIHHWKKHRTESHIT